MRMRFHKATKHYPPAVYAGMTLVEVLIAIVILVAVMGGVING